MAEAGLMETEKEQARERPSIVIRFLWWAVQRIGVGALLSVLLLLAALAIVSNGLADLVRNLEAGQLLPVVVAGTLLAWIMAKSPLPGWLAGVLAAILGGGAILVRVGRLGGTLVTLLQSVLQLAWDGLYLDQRTPDNLLALDFLSPILTLIDLGQGVNTLLIRVSDWTSALFGGRPSFDPIAAELVWSLILWSVSVWAGWSVRRRDDPIAALVPAGTLLTLNIYYTYAKPTPLVMMVGAMLILQGLRSHIVRSRRWQAARISTIDGWTELALAVVGISLMLMIVSALTPSLSIQDLVRSVDRILTSQGGDDDGTYMRDALGLQARARPMTPFEQARSGGLPTQHLLGSGPELSERLVMWVQLEGYPAIPMYAVAQRPELLPPHYYWRSLTYNRYSGRGWQSDETQTIEYPAGEIANTEIITAHRKVVRQKIETIHESGGFLYVTGELVTADQDYRVAWRASGDAFGAQTEAADYWADSLVPRVGEEELRAAGSDYPDWVYERYLQLPSRFPDRVRELALELTATEPTPYDRALAIETYLRTFPYSLDLPSPPPGWDVADYFLFELQEGYCDYFSTAMVVLARAAGLPARLVIGYASGVYDPEAAHFVVTEADAHAWPEIYFPEHGWIEFEPTSGLPPILRPGQAPPNNLADLPPLVKKPLSNGGVAQQIHPVWFWLSGTLAVWALWRLTRRFSDVWRLHHLSPRALMTVLYRRLHRHGRRLALPAQAGDTPYEFAERLTGQVSDLARTRHRRLQPVLAPANDEVRRLINLYVRTLYSTHEPSNAERAEAVQTYHQLRRRLWLVRARKRRKEKKDRK
jgi:transglutaminase-like putative cysteine protease